MATTYSERKVALDEIAVRIRSNDKRLKDARSQIATAEADLTAMATIYAAIVTDIDASATDNPSDTAYQLQKVEKDKMVSEFNTLKTRSTALKTAFDGVT